MADGSQGAGTSSLYDPLRVLMFSSNGHLTVVSPVVSETSSESLCQINLFLFLKELLVVESEEAEMKQEHVSSLRFPFVFCREENKAEHL